MERPCRKTDFTPGARNEAASSVLRLVALGLSAVALQVQAQPDETTSGWQTDETRATIAAGRDVLIRHECTRCHEIDDIPVATRPRSCTGCHDFLKNLSSDDERFKGIVAKYGPDVMKRYQANITHLLAAPDLTRIAARVRPDWIADFLAAPYDVRPTLAESMIRHNLNADEQRKVVRYLAASAGAEDPYAPGWQPPAPAPAPSLARMAEGGKLFRERGCIACHTFGNINTGVSAATLSQGGLAVALAPNLRFIKTRTRPDVMVDWIMDPRQVLPSARMPSMGLNRVQAELIRDFLLAADPQLLPTPAVANPLPPKLLLRKVGYAEMKEKVLGKVCVHCHMNAYEKDPGPGNLGGLGYPGTGLMMRTYESLVWGAVGKDGRRYSVLQPKPGETLAPILKSMQRRKMEERRDHVAPFADTTRPEYPAEPPGMPMGLPSMSEEEMSLLATWIAQGCEGPRTISGKPGINDGYFVPDGPIAKNAGCELRPPAAKRPTWAVDQ